MYINILLQYKSNVNKPHIFIDNLAELSDYVKNDSPGGVVIARKYYI